MKEIHIEGMWSYNGFFISSKRRSVTYV
ncbi:hypothetical protein Golax_025652 [Gossypium laxum]|uniref:Uncharacterized protein n=1 Tax=Gossypium laxum TaxID=34288 RepID=A0A7J9B0W2_9ROSI|nr:hypothetical protein [Gossypium laxum]